MSPKDELNKLWQETSNQAVGIGNPYVNSRGVTMQGITETGDNIWEVFGDKSMYSDLVDVYSDIVKGYSNVDLRLLEGGEGYPQYEKFSEFDPMMRGGVGKRKEDYSDYAKAIINRLISNTKIYGVGSLKNDNSTYGGYHSSGIGNLIDFNRETPDTIFYDYDASPEELLRVFAHETIHGAGSHLYTQNKEDKGWTPVEGTDYDTYHEYEKVLVDIFKKYGLDERLQGHLATPRLLRDYMIKNPDIFFESK